MTTIADLNWCIAQPGSLGVYNLYPSESAACEALTALAAEQPEHADAYVIHFDLWLREKEDRYLACGIREIDAAAYDDALNVLPPLQWVHRDGVERFCMSEFTSGNITNQYARLRRHGVERFFVKAVRFNDQATYITADAISAYDAENDRAPASNRPGDEAAAYAEETGCDYSTALRLCNMD